MPRQESSPPKELFSEGGKLHKRGFPLSSLVLMPPQNLYSQKLSSPSPTPAQALSSFFPGLMKFSYSQQLFEPILAP
ncbi:hypothetical protein RIF29_45409 [Crotalaria pallida]|uniref:Uncharacterized protein n=1 Tax=Crotalaria pallida TaxID=3830 RepID=A0AAN9HLN4_CROPI